MNENMTTLKALHGKLYAGNPHVRFDEGEVASAAMPRRGSLLYKRTATVVCATLACGTAAIAETAPERTHALKVPAKREMLRPCEVKPQGWLRDWCVKSADGEALELVPYGCAKLRVAMFPDDCGRTK